MESALPLSGNRSTTSYSVLSPTLKTLHNYDLESLNTRKQKWLDIPQQM